MAPVPFKDQYEDMDKIVACSSCFLDQGLYPGDRSAFSADAEQLGLEKERKNPCPNCEKTNHKKLTKVLLHRLAYRFFVWGSLHKQAYGAAPRIQFNQKSNTSIHTSMNVSSRLTDDIKLFERMLGIGFFDYGPRFWMIGQNIVPLDELQDKQKRNDIIKRILHEYPEKTLEDLIGLYRIRKSPCNPSDQSQFDSPPDSHLGTGRFDSKNFPVLYVSSDLQVCIHELRVTVEDDLWVASLYVRPNLKLRLLDLSVVLKEEGSEFESLDIAMHLLFLAGKHSYEITRAIALTTQAAGYDGIIYPSYFSLLRTGTIPVETVYGMSNRMIEQLRAQEQRKNIPNLAIFGRPLRDEKLKVHSINKLIINSVEYGFHFGPVI